MIGCLICLLFGAFVGFLVAGILGQAKVAELEMAIEERTRERDRYQSTLEAIANRMGVCALADVEAAARTALEDTK